MALTTLADAWKVLARHRGTAGLACGIAVALTFGPAYAAVGDAAHSSAGSTLIMRSFAASGYPTNTSIRQYRFISAAPLVRFVDKKTAAEVTGTVTFASKNGKLFSFEFDVCYQRQAGGALTSVGGVDPKIQAPADSWLAQTVSGVVGGLSPGQYRVGLCAIEESANTMQASGHGTLILAETTG